MLRRWVRPEWRWQDPDYTVEREVAALSLLERAGITAPRVLATDPTGDEVGECALLMTFLPGGHPPHHLDDVDCLRRAVGPGPARVAGPSTRPGPACRRTRAITT